MRFFWIPMCLIKNASHRPSQRPHKEYTTKENKMSVNESESTSPLNLYSEEDMQNHCVVAESMQKAVELYMQKYGYEPKTLTLISEYVIVQGVGGASA